MNENELKKLKREIRRLKTEADAGVDEFNAGYNAFLEGVPIENEPSHLKYDVWAIGWVWAKYCKEQAAAAIPQIKTQEIRALLEGETK